MTLIKKIRAFPLFAGIITACVCYSYAYPCTIAVISAGKSSTGRPFLWKNRDCYGNWHQEIQFHQAATDTAGDYIMVISFDDLMKINTGDPVNPSGGINTAGFAIVCSTVNSVYEATNINTDLIREALQNCATLSDFELLIENWRSNHPGKVISGNFAAIDAYGGAALYECYTIFGIIGQISFYKFDANTGIVTNNMNSANSVDESAEQYGFVARANSNTFLPNNYGEERRERANEIFTDLAHIGKLNYRNCMSEVAKDVYGQQVNQQGVVENSGDCGSGTDTGCMSEYSTTYCISRNQTRFSLVVDGIASGGDPRLSVLWCLLGEPSVGVFVPYFAGASDVSWLARYDDIDIDGNRYNYNDTSLLARACNRRETYQSLIYDDNDGNELRGMNTQYINKEELAKVQEWSLPLEEFVFRKAEEFMTDLEAHPSYITPDNLKNFSDYCAEFVYRNFNEGAADLYKWTYGKPWDSAWTGYTRGGFENDFSAPAAPYSSYGNETGFDIVSSILKRIDP